MSTNLSGEFSLDITLNTLIEDSFDILQASGSGETLDPTLTAKARRRLNTMLKLWEAQGIHLWTMTEYTLFFQVGQTIYDLTDADVRVVEGEEWSSTTLAAAAAATATSITVDDSTELALGYAIGVINSESDLEWSVIEALPGSDVVNLKDALALAASSGNYVRSYPTKDLATTTLAVAAIATDTIIQVASTVGLAADQQIGIADDTGAVLWTTINSIDFDADEITLDDAIAAASAIGKDVIAYTSEQNFRPYKRVLDELVRRHAGESSDYEIPIVFESRKDYMQLPNKTQKGTVIQAYYSRQQPAGKWYVWNAPNSSLEYINFTAERQLNIMTDADQTFDLPEEWYDALTYQLAKRLIHIVGCSSERRAEIRADATEYLDAALAFDQAVYPIRLVPQQYG